MPNARSLSVQSKLIAAFVALTLTAIAVMSWIGYVSARDSLRASAERELMALQRSKSALVTDHSHVRAQRSPRLVGLAGRDESRSRPVGGVPTAL